MPSTSSSHTFAAALRGRWGARAVAAALAAGTAGAGAARAQTAIPSSAGAPAPTPTVPSPITLDNGLQVIVVENHAVPLATAKLVVRTGAMTQGRDDQGVPHLFEHMLFKGYRGPGARTFGNEAAELQAGYNGTTSEELVTYYLTMPSAGTEGAIGVLARLVRDAYFSPEDLRTERFVVLGEMQRGNSEPRDMLRRAVAAELWRDGWVRKNTIGEPGALLGVTPARLTEIYGRYYVPNNAALVVTGDVSTARVVEAARRHFGGWRRRPDPFVAAPVAPMPPLDSSRAVVLAADVGAVTVQLQWQGPSVRTDPGSTYDADVLSDVVDDDESAFMQRLVHEGPFQSASLGYQTLAHTGPITFTGTTTVEQLPVALSMVLGELMMMRGGGYFEPRALAAAAKRRRVAQALEREEGVTLAHSLAQAWAVHGLAYEATYVDSLARRRPADLTRFVDRYITRRPFVIGVLAPPSTEREVSRMVQQFIEFSEEP